MMYKIQNNPLLSFKLIGGKLFILSDTDFNDQNRKAKISIVDNYKEIQSFKISFEGFDAISELGSEKSISGNVKLILKYSNKADEVIVLADQVLHLIQKSKFKRKHSGTSDQLINDLKKQIHTEWNYIFDEALTSLYDLERSQALPGPYQLVTSVASGSFDKPIVHTYASTKSTPNPLTALLAKMLQGGWAKVVMSIILVFALIQMFIALSSNAIDVKNKQMEGQVFNSIANGSGEDEAVKRVLKEMGIERNTNKNDLGCFVE